MGHIQAPTFLISKHIPSYIMNVLSLIAHEQICPPTCWSISPHAENPHASKPVLSPQSKTFSWGAFFLSAKPSAFCPRNQINTAANSSWTDARDTHIPYMAQTWEALTLKTDFLKLKLLDRQNHSLIRFELIGNSFLRKSKERMKNIVVWVKLTDECVCVSETKSFWVNHQLLHSWQTNCMCGRQTNLVNKIWRDLNDVS